MSTPAAPQVTVEVATARDAPLLANLLELYAHDLSVAFALDVGDDGRFGYEALPRYWSEPDRRFAFLVRCDGRVAGFALVTRGSPASEDPAVLDVAEFFVLRRHRHHGVGRRAATLLWQRFPAAAWTVRVSEANADAVPFWRSVVRDYTGGAFRESTRPGRLAPWCVLAFDSPPA
jgi:predicted acetyltransferase